MRSILPFAVGLCVTAATAETIVPNRTIRAGEMISASDLAVKSTTESGDFLTRSELVGKEARVVLYPNRPVREDDVGLPSVIDRNQLVTLVYHGGGLTIQAEGRSLARGSVGDVIRVMNLGSRSTVFGRVSSDGSIIVRAK